MNNVIEYHGYKARIEYSADDDLFVGTLIGIDDIVGFHGTAVEELKVAMRDSVDFHVEICERICHTTKS